MRLCVCPHLSVCVCARAHRWWRLMTVAVGRQPLPPLLSCRPPTLYKIGSLTWIGWLPSEPQGFSCLRHPPPPALCSTTPWVIGFLMWVLGSGMKSLMFLGTHVTEVSCQATRSSFLQTQTSRLCVQSFCWHLGFTFQASQASCCSAPALKRGWTWLECSSQNSTAFDIRGPARNLSRQKQTAPAADWPRGELERSRV